MHRDELTKWRVGAKVLLNVYEGNRPVCQCHSPEDAARIVAAMNMEQPAPPAGEQFIRTVRHADGSSWTDKPAGEQPDTHRWNYRTAADGKQEVCKGNHGRNEGCEWEPMPSQPSAVEDVVREMKAAAEKASGSPDWIGDAFTDAMTAAYEKASAHCLREPSREEWATAAYDDESEMRRDPDGKCFLSCAAVKRLLASRRQP